MFALRPFSARSCVIGALLACALSMASAHASVSYDLTITNTAGVPPQPPPYATVTLDTVPVGSVTGVKFTVTSDAPGYVLDKFFFNARDLVDNSQVLSLRLVSDSIGGSMLSDPPPPDQTGDGFGKFDYEFDPALTPSDFTQLTWDFTVVATSGGNDVNSTEDNYQFAPSGNPTFGPVFYAAHVRGANNSAFVGGFTESGSGVPEPASLSILAVGAAALLRRKRADSRLFLVQQYKMHQN